MKLNFFHRWAVVEDTGIVHYMQCKNCFKRKVKFLTKEKHPIDWGWVHGKKLFLKDFFSEQKHYERKLKNWQDKNLWAVYS